MLARNMPLSVPPGIDFKKCPVVGTQFFTQTGDKKHCYQCDQIWRNFATLAKCRNIGNIFKVHLVLGKVVNPLWHNLNAYGQIFITVNGQKVKKQSGYLVTLIAISSS